MIDIFSGDHFRVFKIKKENYSYDKDVEINDSDRIHVLTTKLLRTKSGGLRVCAKHWLHQYDLILEGKMGIDKIS